MEEIKDLKVVTSKYVMETLQLLIEKYKFNVDTLSKLLDVKKDVILSKYNLQFYCNHISCYLKILKTLVRCLI